MFFDEIKPSTCSVGVFDSRAKYKGRTTSLPRKCEQYEIEFFTDDGGGAILNENEYKIKKNHIFFSRPGDIRRSLLHFKCFYLHITFSDKNMTEYLKDVPDYFGVSSGKPYYAAIQSLILLRSRKDFESDLLFRSKIAELLVAIRKDALSFSRGEQSSAVYRAERFIDSNFTERITLTDLAEYVHLSPNYFQKLFTKINGSSPRDYITEKRLKYAKELILTKDMDMLEVAMTSGFNSQSYFNYCFKKQNGISPAKFREREFNKYNI